MDVCWPGGTDAVQRVVLTLYRDDQGQLRDVTFEASEGASNSIARCLREVLMTYPWEKGEVPAQIESSPPLTRPSGWQVLAFVRLMSEARYGSDRGLLDPAPLVAACLAHGAARQLFYRVLTSPVRVTAFVEDSARPDALAPATPVTEAERCTVAVLASTVYPGSRGFEVDFGNQAGAAKPASATEVSFYFPPPDVRPADGPLDPQVVRETMQTRQPQVALCWEAALERRAGLSGGRSIRARIAAPGEVEFAHVVTNQTQSPEEASDYLLDKCLVEVVKGTRFPNPAQRSADAVYSWVVARRGG